MNDEAWLWKLVETYERPLCRYACSLTGSASSAQDAVQETFLRLCKADRAKLEGHEAAWLFRVCRSRVFDMKRKEKPVQTMTDRQRACIPSPDPTPAEQAQRNETEATVPRLISRLPERQREAIRLKFQQSLSYREIARVMGVSETNVGFLIHTGIKSLREQMQTLQGALS